MQLIQVSAGAINNDCVEGINAIQWLTENFPGKVWANSLIVLSLLEPIHSPKGGTFSSILSGVAALTEPLPQSGVKQSLSVYPKCRGTNASSLVRRTVLFIPPEVLQHWSLVPGQEKNGLISLPQVSRHWGLVPGRGKSLVHFPQVSQHQGLVHGQEKNSLVSLPQVSQD